MFFHRGRVVADRTLEQRLPVRGQGLRSMPFLPHIHTRQHPYLRPIALRLRFLPEVAYLFPLTGAIASSTLQAPRLRAAGSCQSCNRTQTQRAATPPKTSK